MTYQPTIWIQDDNEFGRTLSNPSSNWDLFFSGRAHLDSIQEPIYFSKRHRRTKVPMSYIHKKIEKSFIDQFDQSTKEIEDSWTISDKEKPLEPEIEEEPRTP
jgi:hypothetical protein